MNVKCEVKIFRTEFRAEQKMTLFCDNNKKNGQFSDLPYYMYMYSMYIYIYTLYGIQDPGPCKHVTVYTDPYPVPHETTNTVYH